MPELPEVENVRRTLEKLVAGKTVHEVEVFWPKIVKHPQDCREFSRILKGQTIHKIGRKGKYLLFYLDRDVLVSHLRMEGKYGLFQRDEPMDKHTHVVLTFRDGKQLRYRDVRKFGTMHVFPIGTEWDRMPLAGLGPEPFSEAFTPRYLHEKLQKTSRPVKSVLLDQRVVAGIGNIYADEALFRAAIHPAAPGSRLTAKRVQRLYEAILSTLREAVEKGGSTVRSYADSQGNSGRFQWELSVYGREGEPCRRCGRPIEKMKLGGRGTHFCRRCQK